MRDLNYQLKQLCQQCREGAYNTQANREHILTLVANEQSDANIWIKPYSGMKLICRRNWMILQIITIITETILLSRVKYPLNLIERELDQLPI